MRALAALVAAMALAGCNSSPDDKPSDAKVIRDWTRALNQEHYGEAASFFVDGAIVEQVREFRLEDRSDAIAFNRSLPCKAEVTDVDDEGDTVLAAFRLRGGPAGGCVGGSARVRFRVKDGKFSEWRQLGEPETPPGEVL